MLLLGVLQLVLDALHDQIAALALLVYSCGDHVVVVLAYLLRQLVLALSKDLFKVSVAEHLLVQTHSDHFPPEADGEVARDGLPGPSRVF